MLEKLHLGLASVLVIGGALASSVDCVIAQIVPDATLGAESSVVMPNAGSLTIDLIQGGATQGANLFHSFEQFSVLTGHEAFFNNAPEIQNIISRVTGASSSNIDGLIRANGTANLFLLNPNGIIFGPNATLAIGGSFLGSTASSINFADGTQFSATAPQTTPLLKISVPIGLQFGANVGTIRNQSVAVNSSGGVGLQVLSGETLTLVGGNVELDGGSVQALGGRVELGGVAEPGTVGLNVDNNNLSLSFPVGVRLSDLSLHNGAVVNVAAGEGGSIVFNAQNIDVSGRSHIYAGIARNLGSTGSQAGDITLNATEAITVGQSSTIENRVAPNVMGNSGNINITTGSLSLTNARLDANTIGKGNAGSVTILARNTVSLDGVVPRIGAAGVFSRVDLTGVGNGGNINITTGSLKATNGARLNAGSAGQGNAGNITINARDTVFLDGVGSNDRPSGIFGAVSIPDNSNITNESSPGQGGNLTIKTGQLIVQNKAEVNVISERVGSAGEIRVEADSIELNAQGKLQAVAVRSQGGNINLQVRDLILMRRQGLISATAGRMGNGGNVTIGNATNAPLVVAFPAEDSDIIAQASAGEGGDIDIFTQGIFGIEARNPTTPQTSDINASSEVGIDGTVEINRLDIDPSQGLVALPSELVDASNQIAAGCAAGSESIARNEFIITGRGGLPPSPNEPFSGETVLTEWATLDSEVENHSSATPSPNPSRVSTSTQIVEANGWEINNKGEIILTANAPTLTPYNLASCSGS